MKRNIAGLILSGLMVVLLTACGENDAGSEGAPEMITLGGVTYTVIAEESDFDKMRSDLTGNYYLWRDVALTGYFEPIGNDSAPFRGIFEGNNKTISNLRIAKSTEDYVGFFGQIGVAGVVQNLTLELASGTESNPSVEGAKFVGALAGTSYGKIEAVGVEGGLVKGIKFVGGLVGDTSTSGDITSSYATGTVSGANFVGGLVGTAGGTITSSYMTGLVIGTQSGVGGLVGTASGDIISSYATGTVSGASPVGGLVGFFTGGTITSSYFDTSITGTNQTQGVGNVSNANGVTGSTTSDISAGGRDPFAGVDWDFDGDDAVWAAQGDGQWPLLAWQLEQ